MLCAGQQKEDPPRLQVLQLHVLRGTKLFMVGGTAAEMVVPWFVMPRPRGQRQPAHLL